MLPPPFRSFLLLAFFALFAAPQLRADEQVFRHDYRGHPGTFVDIQSVFGPVAKSGSLPYRVTIRNQSGRDRVWTVSFSEYNYGRQLGTRSTFRIPVESGREAVREVTFAFAPSFRDYDYRNLEINVNVDGMESERRDVSEQPPQSFPILGISTALALRSLPRLDTEVKNSDSNNTSFAKAFDPAQLPTDWLGYSGLDGILLDVPAWTALSPAQRQALVAWLRMGGRLDLYGEADVDPGKLGLPVPPDASGKRWFVSLGEIRFFRWDGRELPESIVKNYNRIDQDQELRFQQGAKNLESDYDSAWMLFDRFGTKDFNPLFIFFLLITFAILVAPVNLFYFAKAGRRHRLFITTPIISVATCLLIVAVIFFMDGVGGSGMRVVLADLQPSAGETRTYLTQEQVSRTGVMVTSGFEAPQPYDLNPVSLPASRFNPLTPYGQRSDFYDIAGAQFSGPFFRSRSEQGFSLRSVEPGRARIEYAGTEDGKPKLVSNLPQEITALQYRDADGALWKTPAGTRVGPGQTIPLERLEKETWPDWVMEPTQLFSKSRQSLVRRLQLDRHRYFAQVADPAALALPTHPGIRWSETHLLLTGTPSGATSSGTAPTPQPDADE